MKVLLLVIQDILHNIKLKCMHGNFPESNEIYKEARQHHTFCPCSFEVWCSLFSPAHWSRNFTSVTLWTINMTKGEKAGLEWEKSGEEVGRSHLVLTRAGNTLLFWNQEPLWCSQPQQQINSSEHRSRGVCWASFSTPGPGPVHNQWGIHSRIYTPPHPQHTPCFRSK